MRFVSHFFLLCLLCSPAIVQAASFDALKQWSRQDVAVSALAVNLEDGQVIAHFQPDTRLIPASLSKLFTAAVALNHWGSDKRFKTRLLSAAPLQKGVLKGDLILVGKGDPGLTTGQLWPLVAQLKAAGVQQIAGDLLVDASWFGQLPCLTIDRCQARHASRHAYDAGLTSMGVNYASWCVAVTPADNKGEIAEVATCPLPVQGVRLESHVKTVEQGKRLSLKRVTDEQGDRLIVSGHIGLHHQPAKLYVSAGKPAKQAGRLLAAQLAMAGIALQGKVKVTYEPQAGATLATTCGLPLAVLVKRMLNYSNNYMADVLTLDLLAADNTSPLTLSAAADKLQNLTQNMLLPYHLDSGKVPAELASGSGLTTASRLSAHDIVALLQQVYYQPAIFPAFVGALTVPEYSVLGILRGRNPAWQTQVMVKSGSLNEPYTVYAIAGYARNRQGEWLAFAVLLNGTPDNRVLPYAKSMSILRHSVIGLLH